MKPVREIVPIERRKKIRRLFNKFRGSQNQLANKLEIKRQNISNWLNGTTSSEFLQDAILQEAKQLAARRRLERREQAAPAQTDRLKEPWAA